MAPCDWGNFEDCRCRDCRDVEPSSNNSVSEEIEKIQDIFIEIDKTDVKSIKISKDKIILTYNKKIVNILIK